MNWFPWQMMITGAVILLIAQLVMKRANDRGLAATSRFLVYAAIAGGAIWAAATLCGLDWYLPRRLEPNPILQSFLPFVLIWAIANARELKRKAAKRPETLSTYAIKSGFAAGLAGRLFYLAVQRPHVVWIFWRGYGDRGWLIANGLGLTIYLFLYLGKRE